MRGRAFFARDSAQMERASRGGAGATLRATRRRPAHAIEQNNVEFKSGESLRVDRASPVLTSLCHWRREHRHGCPPLSSAHPEGCGASLILSRLRVAEPRRCTVELLRGDARLRCNGKGAWCARTWPCRAASVVLDAHLSLRVSLSLLRARSSRSTRPFREHRRTVSQRAPKRAPSSTALSERTRTTPLTSPLM